VRGERLVVGHQRGQDHERERRQEHDREHDQQAVVGDRDEHAAAADPAARGRLRGGRERGRGHRAA